MIRIEARSSPGRNSTTLENAEETDVSSAVGAVLGAANESDELLRELIAIWDEVSPDIRQAILTIVRQSRTS
ncbi:hypothetical protein CA13_55410 [Planctomycetes bacterium CA13]|uniref:Uncharacterized protein n=1 Tax=Novipirellula herctigrandis TaxID=2527986 RepID=A0A5C5ZA13_9BACT|nr:hypothetical protein CA13_55410 [Planctomycetes bacterium CA13]